MWGAVFKPIATTLPASANRFSASRRSSTSAWSRSTPAPTLPGEILVPDTEPDEHAPYRRPADSLPLVLGPDDAPHQPPDDPHGHPRQ